MPKGVYLHKKGRKVTWNDKISRALTGKKLSDVHCQHISDSLKGRKLSEETKQKIRAYRHTDEAKQKIGEASKGNSHSKGKVLTQDHKDKISRSNKGRIMSLEAREKIRQANLGKKRPEMVGENNPMHNHPNAYRSKFGKTGFREDLGIFVKSSWEANIMRIFKYLGLTVQYEPQSFKLSNGNSYRPDFYISDTEELIEVKGRWIGDAYERYCMFKKEYPGLTINLIGPKEYFGYISEFSKLIRLEG